MTTTKVPLATMTSLSEAGLHQVREDELDALKERLAHHLPHSFLVYGAVSLAMRYGLHSLRPASILVPASPRPSCFTIIVSVTSGSQCIVVFWSLKEHTAKDVADYLSHIPDVNWSQPVLLNGFPSILLPTLQSLGSIGGQPVRIQTKHHGHLYNLQVPTIQGNELPPVYHVTRLKGGEASVVWKNWDFNFMDSEDNVRHDISHFPSVGIRERVPTDSIGSLQEKAQETLVSWVRTTRFGWMGNTFTLPQYRRQGLAGMATVALAHQLLQEGLLALVAIEDINTASIKLHEGLGFKRQNAISIAVLLPAEATDQYMDRPMRRDDCDVNNKINSLGL